MTDTRPTWVIDAQAEETEVQEIVVYGIAYQYTIVVAGIEPALPYVVGFTEEGIIFISEDVPPAYRSHILAHEIRENTVFSSVSSEDRCSHCLEIELIDVGIDLNIDMRIYIQERSRFFDALVIFYETRPEQLAARRPGFLESIKKSQALLRSLVK